MPETKVIGCLGRVGHYSNRYQMIVRGIPMVVTKGSCFRYDIGLTHVIVFSRKGVRKSNDYENIRLEVVQAIRNYHKINWKTRGHTL